MHHFNVRTSGIVTPQAFLGNVCARLIRTYGLPHVSLRPDATQNGGYLMTLLGEIADRAKRKVVVVIDALDESDVGSLLPGTNPLYLPASPPPGVILVVSSRPADDVTGAWRPPRFRADCEQVMISIDHWGEDNMADVRAFIGQWATRRGVTEYRSRHGYDVSDLVENLAQQSEGNFMYLHHVLPAIERGEIRDSEISDLPQGLYQYYSDLLERMRGEDADAWFRYKLPVLTAFRSLRGSGPLSAEDIAQASGITDVQRVKDMLRQWRAFITPVPVVRDGAVHIGYRIYHARFEDFICEEIG